MSPVGLPGAPEELQPETIKKNLNGKFLAMYGYETMSHLWDSQFSPYDIARAVGGPLALKFI
jgi:hypothetical protein